MKTIAIITLAVSVTLLAACSKSVVKGTDDSSDGIPLQGCINQTFSGDNIQLCYDELINDSRCPADVVCVWAGYATAAFTFTKNNDAHPINLSTITLGSQFRKDTTLLGYKIELLDLTPYPRVHTTPSGQPEAKVKITKL